MIPLPQDRSGSATPGQALARLKSFHTLGIAYYCLLRSWRGVRAAQVHIVTASAWRSCADAAIMLQLIVVIGAGPNSSRTLSMAAPMTYNLKLQISTCTSSCIHLGETSSLVTVTRLEGGHGLQHLTTLRKPCRPERHLPSLAPSSELSSRGVWVWYYASAQKSRALQAGKLQHAWTQRWGSQESA